MSPLRKIDELRFFIVTQELKWRKIVIEILTGTKFQEFNDSFIDKNSKSVLAIFNFEKLTATV
jgi:hypothetical protein